MTIEGQLLHSMNIFNYIIKLKSFMTIQSTFRERVKGTSICKTETRKLKPLEPGNSGTSSSKKASRIVITTAWTAENFLKWGEGLTSEWGG